MGSHQTLGAPVENNLAVRINKCPWDSENREKSASAAASSYLHHLRDVPNTDLAPLCGSGKELRAAAKSIAGDLV